MYLLVVGQANEPPSLNNTQNDTLGKLWNVRFTFGDIDLYMQMQVVENTPYEVLLGKPFFALTACSPKHFPNGDEHITITDPNTGRSATIPAVEHSAQNCRELSTTRKPGWRSTARKYQHATFVPDHDASQLYIGIIPPAGIEPTTRLEELPDDDVTVTSSDPPLHVPDKTPVTTPIPEPQPQRPHEMFFDPHDSGPLQSDEELVELNFEGLQDSPDPT